MSKNGNQETRAGAPRRVRRVLGRVVLYAVFWGLLPILMLGAVELTLRIKGIGSPTTPFLHKTIDGKSYGVRNKQYLQQFVSATISTGEWDEPDFGVTTQKAPGTYRIFVFGGSAAYGWPDHKHSFARILHLMLTRRFPETRFEVLNVSYSGMNSHVMLPLARACAELDPDLFVVYMGNNEAHGPFGILVDEGTPDRIPSIPEIRLIFWLNRLYLTQWIRGCADKPILPGLDATGLSEEIPRADDPHYEEVLANFEDNLTGICEAGRRAGVPVCLSTLGANLRHWAPYTDIHLKERTPEEETRWQEYFTAGRALQHQERYEEALAAYRAAAAIDDTQAELVFCMGTAHWGLGDFDEARGLYRRALELDSFAWVRAKPAINEVIRHVAAQAPGAILIDGEQALAEASPHGIPGVEMFIDNCHLTFEGAHTLASAAFESVVHQLPQDIRDKAVDGLAPLSARACSEALLISRKMLLEALLHTVRVDELLGRAPTRVIEAQLDTLAQTRDDPMDQPRTQERVEALTRAFPADYAMQESFVEGLRGHPAACLQEAHRLVAAFPAQRSSRRLLAECYRDAGQLEEALAVLDKNQELFPEDAGNHEMRGDILLEEGRPEEALAEFQQAAEMLPGDPLSIADCARALAEAQRWEEAEAMCQKALALAPHDSMLAIRVASAWRERPPEDRVNEWRRLTREYPGSRAVREQLGMALVYADRVEEAAPILLDLARSGGCAGLPDASREIRGLLAGEGKAWPESRFAATARLALDLDPGAPEPWALAYAYATEVMSSHEACRFLFEALLAHPFSLEGAEFLDELLQQQDDPAVTAAYWRVLAEAHPHVAALQDRLAKCTPETGDAARRASKSLAGQEST